MRDQVTFNAYVMFAGGEEVPEQTGLTRGECVAALSETSEHYGVDLILHIKTDTFPTGFEAKDVTEELALEAKEVLLDGVNDPEEVGHYKGILGDLVDSWVACHRMSALGRKPDMQVDEDIEARHGC